MLPSNGVILGLAFLLLPSNRRICLYVYACVYGFNVFPFSLEEHSSLHKYITTAIAQPSSGSCILYRTQDVIPL
jgi:hypothetical protein